MDRRQAVPDINDAFEKVSIADDPADDKKQDPRKDSQKEDKLKNRAAWSKDSGMSDALENVHCRVRKLTFTN